MVWVETSLLTRGVVFQWASTIKTGRRSDWYKMGPVHTCTHPHLYTNMFIDQAIELDKPYNSRYETEKLSKRL